MAIWDQGMNQFSKDVKQVFADGSSGGDSGGNGSNPSIGNLTGAKSNAQNVTGAKSNAQNVTGENGWQVNSSGNNLSDINANNKINIDSELIEYIKLQITYIMCNLESAQTYFDKIYVSNPWSFVYNETRKCINCCFNILNDETDLDKQSKYILHNGVSGGCGSVMVSNEKFYLGSSFVEASEEIIDDCKNVLVDIQNTNKKQKISNDLYKLFSLFDKLNEKLDIHRNYLVANKDYSGYINGILNDLNNDLNNINNSNVEKAEEIFAKYYIAVNESTEVSENTHKSELLFKARTNTITLEERLELITIDMTEIQQKMAICDSTSSEYIELLKQHDELTRKYYQVQIDYYEQRVNVNRYKHADGSYILSSDEQKLVDAYLGLALYGHTGSIQVKSMELASIHGYGTEDYYHAMILYYRNSLHVDLDPITVQYTDIRKHVTYGNNGNNLSDFPYVKYEKQLEIELAYYVFMEQVKKIEKMSQNPDGTNRLEYIRANFEMYRHLVEMLDRIKDLKPKEEQAAFYETYSTVRETLEDWRSLILYEEKDLASLTSEQYRKNIELKEQYGIASEEELNVIAHDDWYILDHMVRTTTLSLVSGVGTLVEGFIDIATLATVVTQPSMWDRWDAAVSFTSKNLSSEFYDFTVDLFNVNDAIAYSAVHNRAYTTGANLATLFFGIVTMECPVVFAAMTSGVAMQNLYDSEKIDPNKVALAGLAMFAVNAIAADWKLGNIESAKMAADLSEINRLALQNAFIDAGSQVFSYSLQYALLNEGKNDGVDYVKYLLKNASPILMSALSSYVSVQVATKAFKDNFNTDKLPSACKDAIESATKKYVEKNSNLLLDEYLKAKGFDASSFTDSLKQQILSMPFTANEFRNFAIGVARQNVTSQFVDSLFWGTALVGTFSSINIDEVKVHNEQASSYIVELSNSAITYAEYEIKTIKCKKEYSDISNGHYLPTADSYLSDEFICAYIKSLFPDDHIIQGIPSLTGIANRLSYGYSMDFVTFQNASATSSNIATTGSFGFGNVQTGGMKAVPKWYLEEYAKENPNVCYFDSNGRFIIKDYTAFSNKFMGGECLDSSVGVYMVETRVPLNGDNIGIPSAYNLNNESLNYLDYLSVNETTGKIDEILPVVSVAPFDIDSNLLTNKVYQDDTTGIQYCVSYVVGGK